MVQNCPCARATSGHLLPAQSAAQSGVDGNSGPKQGVAIWPHLTHSTSTNVHCNYYHLSPHIRAHVLCAPPRARYVFLTTAVGCNGAHRYGGCFPAFLMSLLPTLHLPDTMKSRPLAFGHCFSLFNFSINYIKTKPRRGACRLHFIRAVTVSCSARCGRAAANHYRVCCSRRSSRYTSRGIIQLMTPF